MLPQSKIFKFGLAPLAVAATFTAALLALAPGAQADIVVQCQSPNVTPGTATTTGCVMGNVNGGDQNILFNSPNAIVSASLPNATVMGFTNQSDTPVDFTSTTDALQVNNTGGGAATITSTTDNFIDNLSYYIPNPPGNEGFTEFDTNLDTTHASGSVDFIINAVDSLGNPETFDTGVLNLTQGGNKFAFIATNGEVITKLTYNSADIDMVTMETVKQNQITVAPLPGTGVPEPASLALFGTALAGFGLLGRRRRKNV